MKKGMTGGWVYRVITVITTSITSGINTSMTGGDYTGRIR